MGASNSGNPRKEENGLSVRKQVGRNKRKRGRNTSYRSLRGTIGKLKNAFAMSLERCAYNLSLIGSLP